MYLLVLFCTYSLTGLCEAVVGPGSQCWHLIVVWCSSPLSYLFSTLLLPFHSGIWGFPHFLNLKVTGLSLIDLAVAFPALPTLGCTSLFLLVLGFKRLKCLGRLASKLWTLSQCLRMSSWAGRTHLINLVSWPPVDFFFFFWWELS